MELRYLISLLGCIYLAGCVTSSPDLLLASNEPTGTAKVEGQYPIIGRVPTAQTSQITSREKKALKAELDRDVQSGQKQAIVDQEKIYKKEVADQKKLARENHKATVKRIESQTQGE